MQSKIEKFLANDENSKKKVEIKELPPDQFRGWSFTDMFFIGAMIFIGGERCRAMFGRFKDRIRKKYAKKPPKK